MNEVQTLVLATMRELRETLVEFAVKAVELNPDQNPEHFPRRDLEQMVEGTFVAAQEFYVGGERPFWQDYLATVIPGILGAGFRLPQVLHTVSSFFCLSATELDRRLSDHPKRNEARLEFVRFSSAWQHAILSVPES